MGYGPPTKTLGELMRAVKRQFGDESGVQLEDTDIVAWANDAQTMINNRNKVLKTKSSSPAVVGQAVYDFPADQIYILESVHYDGRRIPNVSFPQAEENVIGVDPDATGTPELWYEWEGQLTFWPAPDDTKTITLYYTRKPALLSEATPIDEQQLLDLPDKYYSDVIRYCMQQAYEMDEDWAASQAKKDQFDQSVGDLGEQERVGQFMTYETLVVYDN